MAILRIGGFDPSMKNFGLVKADIDMTEGFLENLELLLVTTAVDTKNKKLVRKNVLDLERSQKLYKETKAFFKDVDVICVELPVGSQSASAMKSYGVCIALTAALEIPLIHVTATEVKLAGHGNKNATKKQMIDWAVSEYPDAPWLRYKKAGAMVLNNANEHLADALAAIHAGVTTDQFDIYQRLYSGTK
jgi:Holliday junction resolvasome RuvABC endonuclease subunit